MSSEEAEKLLSKIAVDLGEHFEAVQIMVSWGNESGGTTCVKRGYGNWYARHGMAHDFITTNTAQEHAAAMKQAQDEGA